MKRNCQESHKDKYDGSLPQSYLESKQMFEVREMKKTHQCNIKKGKHLFLLAYASMDVISVEIINPRLSGRSEFKILCNIVCIFHKLCHNFVLKTSLFFLIHRTG